MRDYPVAVSTEALALGWLRGGAAPHGAVVIADREISARTRDDSAVPAAIVNASVSVRVNLPADHADILFATALLAAASGCSVFGEGVEPHWPEFLVSDRRIGAVRVATQLSPGVVESAVMSFRLGFGVEGSPLHALTATMTSLERSLAMTPTEVSAAYTDACRLTGRRVRVNLKPRGAAGGVGAGVDERGAFGVRSSSGAVARHRVDEINSIELDA